MQLHKCASGSKYGRIRAVWIACCTYGSVIDSHWQVCPNYLHVVSYLTPLPSMVRHFLGAGVDVLGFSTTQSHRWRLSSSQNNIAMHFEGSTWTLWRPYLTRSLAEHLRKAFELTSNGVSRFCVWVALKLIEGQSSLLNILQISIAGKVLRFCVWIFQPSPADISCPGSRINYLTSKHLKISTLKFHFRTPVVSPPSTSRSKRVNI